MPATVHIPVQTGHIGLNVTDLDRSIQFYRDVFGFEVVRDQREGRGAYAFLGDGERLVLTLWQQSEGRFETGRPGLHHLSFEVADIGEVQVFEERLRALGTSLHYDGIVAHAEKQASGGLFFEDPDGTRLEIYSRSGAASYGAALPDAPACGFF